MTNHVHLIAVPEREDSLAKAMGRKHRDYARWLHVRERQTGHPWQNRFYSCPLDAGYCWAALRYVERNDVRKPFQLEGGAIRLRDAQILLFNETRWVRPRPIRIRTDKGIPRNVSVLETEWNAKRLDFWIRKKDFLPVRILHHNPNSCDPNTNPLGPIPYCDPNGIYVVYYDLADYRPVDGIQIPHRFGWKLAESERLLAGQFGESPAFILNPRLRDDLFSTIPRSEDPADAWKPREEWGSAK